MKLTNSEMAGISLFILFIVYLYYTHMNTTVHETQPVYYPIYKTQYIPVSRPRPRRYPVRIPRRHRPRHKPRFIPGVPNPIQPIPQSTLPFQQMKCDKDKDGNFINCK